MILRPLSAVRYEIIGYLASYLKESKSSENGVELVGKGLLASFRAYR